MRSSGCAQATRKNVREEWIGRVHALETLADDASAANPDAVLRFDDDRFDVLAARLGAHVEDAWRDDLSCSGADAETGLQRRRDERLSTTKGLFARARHEREERGARDVERIRRAWSGVEDRPSDERVDD